jgi:hypothetical protein
VSDGFADGKPALEIEQLRSENLICDLAYRSGFPPDDLKDRTQAAVVVTSDDRGAVSTLLKRSAVPRKYQSGIERLNLLERLEVVTERVSLSLLSEIDVRCHGRKEVVSRYE